MALRKGRLVRVIVCSVALFSSAILLMVMSVKEDSTSDGSFARGRKAFDPRVFAEPEGLKVDFIEQDKDTNMDYANIFDDFDQNDFVPGSMSTAAPIVINRNRSRRRQMRDARLGSLRGGPANCRPYEAKGVRSRESTRDCVSMKTSPPAYVCLHPFDVDKYISFTIERDGLWEGRTLEVFKRILLSDKELGVYDIGANIGVYSMVAATLGHKVVAVEPLESNLERLHLSRNLNNVQDKVVILQNAVSNRRGAYRLSVPRDNRGGVRLTSQDADRFCDYPEPCPPWTMAIVLNDLLEVTNFERAVIKIDVEGHEHLAMRTASRLFRHVTVTHVFMEWQNLRSYYGSEADESRDKTLVFEMIGSLKNRGFCPLDVAMTRVLSLNHWYGWPDDIIWVHSNYSGGAILTCK